jgi:Leucine-rich repeat (LRR) protein
MNRIIFRVMQDIIKEEIGEGNPSKVKEISVVSWKADQIELQDVIYLEKFGNLKFLAINKAGLTSLDNFPVLPQLIHLDLSHNSLTGNLKPLTKLTNLMHLDLSHNKISDLSHLSSLKSLSTLVSLNLFENPIETSPTYRSQIFSLIPSLRSLDGCDENDEDISVSCDEDLEDISSLSEELLSSSSDSSSSPIEYTSRSKRPRDESSEIPARKYLKKV